MAERKPPGFLHVDADGLWAIRQCYGRPEGDGFAVDPCWEEGIPRLSGLFREAGAVASFFLVGRDLELPGKRAAAKRLGDLGFELANHSYSHPIGMTRRPLGFVYQEIKRTDESLRALGARPCGFRSPGYDVDTRILRVLRRMGYLYDASLLPTHMAPILKTADAVMARRIDRKKKQFGRFSYGRAPRHPYFPRLHSIRKPADGANTGLLEIPVGTTPRLRLPLTASFLFPQSRHRIRRLFARLAQPGRPVTLLLHAIDGTDCRQPIVFGNRRPRVAGFAMDGNEKERKLREIIDEFLRFFRPVRSDEYAAGALGGVL